MSPFFPDPQGLKFSQWGAMVAEQLAFEGVTAPRDELGWMDWAQGLLYAPALAVLPEPNGFHDWQSWASACVQSQVR